jgi:hypothetical protein
MEGLSHCFKGQQPSERDLSLMRGTLSAALARAVRGVSPEAAETLAAQIAARLDESALLRFAPLLVSRDLPVDSEGISNALLNWIERDEKAMGAVWIAPEEKIHFKSHEEPSPPGELRAPFQRAGREAA